MGNTGGGDHLGLSSHIPAHREIFRELLGRTGAGGAASSEDFYQRNLQEGSRFVAYETGAGRIGLLRTGLPEEKSGIPEHWGSNPVRELVVQQAPVHGRGIDVVPLAERFMEAAAAAGTETNKNQSNIAQYHTQAAQQQALQAQVQHTETSTTRAHGRGHQPGGTTCKECGNQAKKDCQFQRCRTCCKSRGYDCTTHVRSTWVPAAKRRERQAIEAAAIAAGQPRPRSKRTRSLAFTAATGGSGPVGLLPAAGMAMSGAASGASPLLGLPGASSPHTSDLPAASFRGVLPSEVRAQALFKCVKVTGIEDGENEYAYQATVKIGGHVFKGVLYDQGADAAPTPVANLADLQLGARSIPSSSGYIDPSQIYGSNTLLGALR